MTWTDLAELLEREKTALFGGSVPSLQILVQDTASNICDAFASSDRRLKAKLGDIVLEFAAIGRWPELAPAEKVLLFHRLNFGIALVQSLAYARTVAGEEFLANPPDIPYSKEELIQWALEYAWNDAGQRYALALCASLSGRRLPPQNVPNN